MLPGNLTGSVDAAKKRNILWGTSDPYESPATRWKIHGYRHVTKKVPSTIWPGFIVRPPCPSSPLHARKPNPKPPRGLRLPPINGLLGTAVDAGKRDCAAQHPSLAVNSIGAQQNNPKKDAAPNGASAPPAGGASVVAGRVIRVKRPPALRADRPLQPAKLITAGPAPRLFIGQSLHAGNPNSQSRGR